MEKQTRAAILRFLRNVALIDLGIFATTGLVCWFGGWRTAYYYGNGLMLAGVLAMSLGLCSLMGNWGLTRSFSYQHAASAGVDNIQERTRREINDTDKSYAFLVLMSVVGIVSIALGILIQTTLG